ncbi:hypothetical protein Peetri_00192 [Pseudomonas phage vB_PpuM-Peetri]
MAKPKVPTRTVPTLYQDWGLYSAICELPEVTMLMMSRFVADRTIEHAERNDLESVSIMEPFSGPIPYYEPDIRSFLTRARVDLDTYDHVEYLDHGELSEDNSIIIGDITTIDLKQKYDVIYGSYGSLACLLLDQTHNKAYEKSHAALVNIREHLKPNGIFILNANGSSERLLNDLLNSDEPDQEIRVRPGSQLGKAFRLKPDSNALLRFTYQVDYDRCTTCTMCYYSDMVLSVNGVDIQRWEVESPTYLAPLDEPELIRMAGMAGFNLGRTEFYGLDTTGYPAFFKMDTVCDGAWSPAEFVVFRT